MNISILGAGAFGTALGQILSDNGHEVIYYDPALKVDLEESLEGAELLVLVVPSFALPDLLPKLPRKTPIIVATKGVLSEEIFRDFADVMAVSGPTFAEDLKAHRSSIMTSTDIRIDQLFKTSYLDFDHTNDIKGVFLCGALKNVYALLAGLIKLTPETLEFEAKISAFAEEMKALLSANGALPETVDLSCGIGDLRLTCGPRSRNYEYGCLLREDPTAKTEKTVEGLSVLKRIVAGEIVVPSSATNLINLIERSKEWA